MKLWVCVMGQTVQTEQEKLIASLTALLADEGLRADQQRLCLRCGAVMQHLDATFWLYESDREWRVRLPFCPCEQKSTSPVQTLPPLRPRKRAARWASLADDKTDPVN